MKHVWILVVISLATPGLVDAQIHREAEPSWYELHPGGADRVAIDRNSFQVDDDVRRAKFRWHLLSSSGRSASYTIEDTEVDCRQHQGRVVARWRVTISPRSGRTVERAEVPAREQTWHSYSPRTLASESWARFCELPVDGA